MADGTELRLVLRGHTIADAAGASDAGGELFVVLAKPPPVGSLLEAFDGGDRGLLEVARVVESDSSDGGRGFFGRRLDDDGGRLTRVGSEHLEATDPAGIPSTAQEEESSSYPVPAPVLEAEPSEPIDLGRPDEQHANAQQLADEAAQAHEAEGEDAGDGAEAAPEGEDKPKGRGKKRKGRKRG